MTVVAFVVTSQTKINVLYVIYKFFGWINIFLSDSFFLILFFDKF